MITGHKHLIYNNSVILSEVEHGLIVRNEVEGPRRCRIRLVSSTFRPLRTDWEQVGLG